MSAASAVRTAAPIDTLGRPMRDLRISVTDRCNFRCTYCMPAEVYGERYRFLPRAELLRFEEIARVTRVLTGFGVRKVRVTGGEPLVRPDLPDLIVMLAKIEGIDDLTLTTNGYLLAEHAQALADAGLRRVTVSLDSLDPTVFGAMNGRGYRPERVLEGIEAAQAAGLGPVKINAVIERGVNDHTAIDLARHFKGTRHIVRFIEFMDVGNLNHWEQTRVVPSAELIARIDAELPIEPIAPNYAGEVAERWRYRDGEGEIGFISSVSEPFCGGCTRIRLSPEGSLYTCLFGSSGADVRGPLRDGASDDDLAALLHDVWTLRADRYSELRSQLLAHGSRRKVEMYQIGG